ncbi:MAG: hypothetical protein K2X50_05255 [Gammaproteobacteria bacterium]|nr:hypothetical protein [Gammaproteobacteria bacterium]
MFEKKEKQASELVNVLATNFKLLSENSNEVRQLINSTLNTFANHFTSIDGKVYKKEEGALVADKSNEQESHWEKIIEMLECYHHIQRNFYEISSIYLKLELPEKIHYWEMQKVQDPVQVAKNFDKVLEKFSSNFLDEPARSYVLGDLFRGYHNQKGRSLLDQTIISARVCKVDVQVVPGTSNLATIKIKDNRQDSEAMATANLDDSKVADQSPREYVRYLLDETIYGKPGALACVILQYIPAQNIVFLDTADTEGKHLYYLSENYVTVMHELGHMWSFLGGTNYHPETPIPIRLEPFHTAEEYMTTGVRPYCEDRFDPLNIQRVSHNAREFKSMEDFKENKEFLIDSEVKLQRQGDCDKYIRRTTGETKEGTVKKLE